MVLNGRFVCKQRKVSSCSIVISVCDCVTVVCSIVFVGDALSLVVQVDDSSEKHIMEGIIPNRAHPKFYMRW